MMVLRLAPTAPGGRQVVVEVGPADLPHAERLAARMGLLESVRSGQRAVEIVSTAGGAR
ncbi:hypothetical protein ABT336_14530 [Micromonospora sp. NPDC000207]|uniref:hypothetical protein n=1 Tax=Micromonospora sp. NPDC000207 TaxID=3154246 RepID=UPI00331FB1FF